MRFQGDEGHDKNTTAQIPFCFTSAVTVLPVSTYYSCNELDIIGSLAQSLSPSLRSFVCRASDFFSSLFSPMKLDECRLDVGMNRKLLVKNEQRRQSFI